MNSNVSSRSARRMFWRAWCEIVARQVLLLEHVEHAVRGKAGDGATWYSSAAAGARHSTRRISAGLGGVNSMCGKRTMLNDSWRCQNVPGEPGKGVGPSLARAS